MKSYQFDYQLIKANPNQPILLFLHGFMGNHHDFQDCISQLSQTFSCLTVDLPGHGNTQVQGDEKAYRMEATATALIELLDQLQISSCDLIGYSMGGRFALYLILHYPQRFRRGILESASPGLRNELERSQRLKTDLNRAKRLETENFDHFLTHWYHQPLFNSLKYHPKFDQMFHRRRQNNPLELAKSLRNMGTGVQPSLWEKLSELQIPILLMVGENDQKFIAINQEMAQRCPTATLTIIPNCGHNVHLENPQNWVKTVQAFCQVSE